jgi:DNA-binding CsgD family transcriptional regulator
MEIEKISWHTFDARDQRHVLVSLPRVKWLERDPEYRRPTVVEEPKVDRRKDNRVGNKAKVSPSTYRPRNDELSDAQRQAWLMHKEGKTMAQIGVQLKRSTNAASKLVAQAREKLGVGLK